MRIFTLAAALLATASLGTSGGARDVTHASAALAPAVGAPPPPLGYVVKNFPYDGRFTFLRIRFTPRPGFLGYFEGHPDVKWDHDFPRAETHFMKIIQELTSLDPVQGGGNILSFEEPDVFKYPVAYMCEPGFWAPNDAEVAGMRAYLLKGGFLILDDFFGQRTMENLETQMHRVIPDGRFMRLTGKEPIFDAFFRVDSLEDHALGGRRGPPEFWGLFEDNDSTKRLMVVANYNNDIGESWEWSDTGVFPVDVTSTSYKLGVNYLMYSMTH
jgi:hypothetical protein